MSFYNPLELERTMHVNHCAIPEMCIQCLHYQIRELRKEIMKTADEIRALSGSIQTWR